MLIFISKERAAPESAAAGFPEFSGISGTGSSWGGFRQREGGDGGAGGGEGDGEEEEEEEEDEEDEGLRISASSLSRLQLSPAIYPNSRRIQKQ